MTEANFAYCIFLLLTLYCSRVIRVWVNEWGSEGGVFSCTGWKIIPASSGNTADNCWKLDMSGEAYSPQQSEFPSGFITGSFRPHHPSTWWVRGPLSPFLSFLKLENLDMGGRNNDDKLTLLLLSPNCASPLNLTEKWALTAKPTLEGVSSGSKSSLGAWEPWRTLPSAAALLW